MMNPSLAPSLLWSLKPCIFCIWKSNFKGLQMKILTKWIIFRCIGGRRKKRIIAKQASNVLNREMHVFHWIVPNLLNMDPQLKTFILSLYIICVIVVINFYILCLYVPFLFMFLVRIIVKNMKWIWFIIMSCWLDKSTKRVLRSFV